MTLRTVSTHWWAILTTTVAVGSWVLLYFMAGRLEYGWVGYVVLLSPLVLTASAWNAIRTGLRTSS